MNLRFIFCSIYLLLLFSNSASGQAIKLESIGFYTGINLSGFLKGGNSNPSLSLKSRVAPTTNIVFDLGIKRFVLRPELGYSNLGCAGTLGSQELSYKLRYLGFNLGLLFKVVNTDKFSLSPGISYGAAYMTEGEQYIGNARFSNQTLGFLNKVDLTGQVLLRFAWKLSDLACLQSEYRYGLSILNLENNQNNQITRNYFHSLLIGIGFQLNKKDTKSAPEKPVTNQQ
jgi:hypothetical protein